MMILPCLLAASVAFRTFTTEIDVEFDTPEDAQAAEARALEMPPGKSIAFSSRWDDTNRRHPLMADAFSAAGAKATFYLNNATREMREEYAGRMLSSGHAFGGHSITHPFLPDVDTGSLWWNVMENRVRIETALGTCVCGFALPYYSATNPVDPSAAPRLGEALSRAGYLGGPEKLDLNSWKTYGLKPETWVSAYCFDCQDSNPSASAFAAGIAEGRRLAAAGEMPCGPQLALGVHTRQTDDGLRRLTEILKTETSKQDVWCCTENEYVAWRMQYLHNRVAKRRVAGRRATFAVERVEPFELGGLADYALDFTRPAKGGVRVLKPDAAHPLPTAFGRLEKSLVYDSAAGTVTLTLKNPTEGDLSDVDVTLRLPLAWKNGIRRVNRPRLARGETWTETFNIGPCPPSEGDLYFVAQVDAKTSPTTRGRWYATDVLRRPLEPTITRGLPDCWPDYYVNGKPLSFVVEPADGSWFEIKDIVDANGVFTYEGDAPSKWKVAEGVWLHGYWANDWYDETVRVKAIDPKTRTITLAAKPKYGVGRKPHISPRRFRRVARPNPCRYKAGEIEVVTNRAPLMALVGVTNQVVSGRVFEKGLGDGLLLSNCVNVVVRDCTFRHLRGVGVRVEGGSNCRVENCRVEDTGRGGVFLTGGDRQTLTPGGHEVTRCVIRRFSSHQLTYAEGVHLEGVGNRATRNFIADTPHQAAFMRGNDLLFAGNVVSNAVYWGDDSAALYMGRNWSCTGNVIERNLFIDIGTPRGHGNCAVYFDDGEGLGDIVRSNRFVRCGFPCTRGFGAIHVNGGFGVLAEGNTFVDCERAFGSTVWTKSFWLKASRAQQGRLFKAVNATNEPYASRYPFLAQFADMEKIDYENARCIARNNTLVDCRSVVFPLKTKWDTNENNVVRFMRPRLAAEPVVFFKDYDIRDYGAVAEKDGEATEAIAKAVEACRKAPGGGRIVVPAGNWLSGPIRLTSGMVLHLAEGARLSFVTNFARYYAPPALTCMEGMRHYGPAPCVYAYKSRDVGITGTGELNGNGAAWWPFKFMKGGVPGQRALKAYARKQVPVEERRFEDPSCGLRPNFVQFYDCDRVIVQDVTLRDGPCWNLHPFLCRDVVVRNVKFVAHGPNNDGVDPDCCQRVLIEDCFFDVGDDCVVLKAGWNEDGWAIGVPTTDVTVRRCRSVKGLGGLTFGSEISAGVSGVLMEDCELNGCRDAIYAKSMPGRGGYVRDVLIRNVKIGMCADAPIKLSLLYKKTPPNAPHVPDFSGFRIENVEIEKGSPHPIVVEGVPHGPIRNVDFRNVRDASGRKPRVTNAENVTFDGNGR